MGICILWRLHAAAILGPYPGQIVVKRGGCAHYAVLSNWGWLIGGWWDYKHIASCKLPIRSIRLIRAISCCWNHTLYSNHFIYNVSVRWDFRLAKQNPYHEGRKIEIQVGSDWQIHEEHALPAWWSGRPDGVFFGSEFKVCGAVLF